MTEPGLDVVTIGRVSVDLYGQQIGGRLEDMASFAKYVGGCPANIAIGCARLGLRAALVSRVGDEHMGRFVREQLEREGVDTRHLATDPERLTALVILGIRDRTTFPLIFFRERCADMGLGEVDIDESLIASAKAVVVTGTHFSAPSVAAASRRAIALARRHGRKVVLDIDYRPVLWGLTGHGQGERRFVGDADVTAHLQQILPGCDVVVGTEEEIHAAGGSTDTLAALRTIRGLSRALIVVKRGALGSVAYPEAIPSRIEDGVTGEAFPVEVYNVLGAGDGFMSGFLRGYLDGLPLAEACRYANAAGALVVSRHGCAPAAPTWAELRHFFDHGSSHRAVRFDPVLNHIHWATTRREKWPEVLAMALDHRAQFENMADRHRQPVERIAAFKRLAYRAVATDADRVEGFGLIVDDRYGGEVLDEATGGGSWLARPIERPERTPLEFEGGADVGLTLRDWPVTHTVKCLVFYRADDPDELRACQERRLKTLSQACRLTEHELLLEVIPDRTRPGDAAALAAALRRLYEIGIKPDWWKLPAPESADGWSGIADAICEGDPYCRGVLMLGLGATEADLVNQIESAARQPICRGFAIGRTIFAAAAEAWFAGKIDDAAAAGLISETYGRLVRCWRRARATLETPLESVAG